MKKKSKMTVGAQLIMTLGLMMLSMFIVGACGYLMRNNSVETETELYENYGKTQRQLDLHSFRKSKSSLEM